jgi:SanA protein
MTTRSVLNVIVSITLAAVLGVLLLQYHITRSSRPYIKTNLNELDHAYVGIVLGASVRPDKSLSPILQDRVDAAFLAYESGIIDRFLLSGDHGSTSYDEVNAMKDYLNAKGVKNDIIFLDHAGFDTYDSMYRARAVFKVQDAIVFTQDFHLPRAIYLARKFDLNIQGYKSDMRVYGGETRFRQREWLANIKAWFEININKRPSYVGEDVPITGDSSLSHDR